MKTCLNHPHIFPVNRLGALLLLLASVLSVPVAMGQDKRLARECIAIRTASVRMDRTGTATYVKNTNRDHSLTVVLDVTNTFTGKTEGQETLRLGPGEEKQVSWVSDFSPTLRKRYAVAGAEYR